MTSVPRVLLLPLRAVRRAWVLQALADGARVTLMEKSLQQIVALRVQQGLADRGFRTREEFASEAGMSRATLNRVLSGDYDLRLSTLESLAAGLGVPVSTLFQADSRASVPERSAKASVGAKKRSAIVVKILVPKDEEVPAWLVDACRQGAGQIEQEPPKRKPQTTGTSPRRSVGLKEILRPGSPAKVTPKKR